MSTEPVKVEIPKEAREAIRDLVDRYERSIESYRSPEYKEAQLREEFINPFFEALGWDVYNRQGAAPAYRDVIHEDSIKTSGGTKAPDYCFSLSGRRMFFVETKKPSKPIKHDIESAFQLRRYAWSAHLQLSILTNFEQFAVYESRQKPNKNDSAAVERVSSVNYREYLDRLDEIAGVFSRTAVVQGSFDKFFISVRGKRGTQEVDTEFLKEIEEWRENLARNIAVRNPALSVSELNYAVQATIDRIVFLRMCEDRGIEPYKQLLTELSGGGAYRMLCGVYALADEKYNSGLFHFKTDRERKTMPDMLSLSLNVDDKILQGIVKSLYYPESPYEFSVLKPEILGNVYERFLGKIIRLTPSHRAVLEEKPEVKKAGGVFYTPQFIVDYMVKSTLGKLCKGKRPSQISGLRVLDPACGSGSFLLGAYAFLLDFHLDHYVANRPDRRKDEVYQGTEGQWFLTTREKKRILLNHIFGVDRDSQAVEVTKLGLLLKVLEGERKDVLERQQKLFREKALPDLEQNIKCGNSLIGPDFFEYSGQTRLFDETEITRINPFDWRREYSKVFESGGFGVVIGNPPYVDIKGLPEDEANYIVKGYKTSGIRINLFAAFMERSLRLVNPKLFAFSMIVPTSLMSQSSYKALRTLIGETCLIDSIVRLPNESFGSSAGMVKVDTAIVVLGNRRRGRHDTEIVGYSGYERIDRIVPEQAKVHRRVNQKEWMVSEDQVWSFNTSSMDENIIAKCQRNSAPLEDCVDISLGLTPYDKYRGHSVEQIANRIYHSSTKKDSTYGRLLSGNDVSRYFVAWGRKEWISYGPWLGAQREPRFFTEKRILVKQIIDWSSKRIWAALTEEELYNTQNAFNLLPKEGWNLEYIVGILNSKLMTFYHRKKFLDEFKMRFQKILIKDCRKFPMHICNPVNKAETELASRMTGLVKTMAQLNLKRNEKKLTKEISVIDRAISVTDAEIDKLVYDLYGLSRDEIAAIECEMARPSLM